MRPWLPAVALALLVGAGAALAAWTTGTVAELGSRVRDLTVGDGDNDGRVELYAVADDRQVWQITWTGSVWSVVEMGTVTGLPLAVLVADVNPAISGVEVYVGDDDGRLYRFQWNGTGQGRWNHVRLFDWPSAVLELTAGDGNGDGGTREGYAGTHDGILWRFLTSHSTFAQDVADAGAPIHALGIGDADHDGKTEVVLGTSDGRVLKVDSETSGWTTTRVGTSSGRLDSLAVVDTDDDGDDEVMVSQANRRVVRYACCWTNTTVYTLASEGNDLAAMDLDADGRVELHLALQDGRGYRLEWDSSGWDHEPLGSGGSGLKAVAVGDADRDGATEAYAGSGLGRLVEFEP